MKRHIADYGDVNAAEWFILIAQGYFENSNPDMVRLNDDFYLIDSYRRDSIEKEKRAKTERAKRRAYSLATSRVHDLNRKVGKRETAK